MSVRVLPGAEPFAFAGGPTGVLLLHGFTGNPSSMRPMGAWLAERGHTVVGPRLPGHGTSWRQLARCRWQRWVEEAASALEGLAARCETVVACGQSAGGAIALHLGATRADLLAGVVAVNPYVRDRRHALLPLARPFLRTVRGVGSDIKRPSQEELAYERIPIPAVVELARMLKAVRRELPSMRLPLLLFESAEDHVVPAGTADYVLGRVGTTAARRVVLADSYHVATLDNDAPTIFEETDAFVRELAGR